MSLNTDKINLLGMSQDMLEQFFAARDEKPFRARQILQWIYQRGVTDFDER
jgi:23S rRNA (adenine2503-C2)-methyltransferase